MTQTERQLIEKLEELVGWLNQECPSVAPPLEPYRNYDLTHTFCESLRFRLDSLAALKQQVGQEEKTDEARLKKELIKFCKHIDTECGFTDAILEEMVLKYLKQRTNGNNQEDIH
jgi:hypothetical protein